MHRDYDQNICNFDQNLRNFDQSLKDFDQNLWNVDQNLPDFDWTFHNSTKTFDILNIPFEIWTNNFEILTKSLRNAYNSYLLKRAHALNILSLPVVQLCRFLALLCALFCFAPCLGSLYPRPFSTTTYLFSRVLCPLDITHVKYLTLRYSARLYFLLRSTAFLRFWPKSVKLENFFELLTNWR